MSPTISLCSVILADSHIVRMTVWNIKDMRKNACRGEEGYMEWHGKIANALDDLDSLGGVLVTVSAGNDGRKKPPGHTDEYMPNILSARHGSPLIITGAVNNHGQLARLSSPGSVNVPITCYAAYVSTSRMNSDPPCAPSFGAILVFWDLLPACSSLTAIFRHMTQEIASRSVRTKANT